jgi:hypothetical protein
MRALSGIRVAWTTPFVEGTLSYELPRDADAL